VGRVSTLLTATRRSQQPLEARRRPRTQRHTNIGPIGRLAMDARHRATVGGAIVIIALTSGGAVVLEALVDRLTTADLTTGVSVAGESEVRPIPSTAQIVDRRHDSPQAPPWMADERYDGHQAPPWGVCPHAAMC